MTKSALMVLPTFDDGVVRASRNIKKLYQASVNTLNVYDILRAGQLIVTKDAISGIEEVFAQ